MRIRRHLHAGDLGEIAALHGRIYSQEWGHDATFEAMVAASLAEAGGRGWPRPHEGIWVVEDEGRMVGCLGLTDEGAGEARLRWFVLDPPLRGRGFGRALLNELFAKAEAVGYERITLETFSDLAAAAHLYRERGFELIWEDTRPRWGRPAVTYQHYELELTPSERPRRGPPEGGSLSEPASVPPRGGRAGAAPMAAGRRPRSTQAA